MDMIFSSINAAASSAGTAAASTANAKSATNASSTPGFQSTLVNQMSGSKDLSDQASISVAVLGVPAGTGQEGTFQEELPNLEQLMALIDSLIDQLGNDSGDAAAQPDMEELGKALEAIQALLALLGLPVIRLDQVSGMTGNQTDSSEAADLVTSNALKSSLQDALLQLQGALQQGNQKQVQGQEPIVFAAKQVGALAALLNGTEASKGEVAVEKESKSLPTWLNAQPNASKDASVFLHRMSQQAIHPSLLASAMQGTELANQSEAAPNLQGETTTQVPVSLLSQHHVREQAPLTSTTAQTSSFVVADDFADTMRGMIVQKFDIRTLNGVSEARLTLYPEHLGSVDVRISMQSGILTAVFLTDTAQAKDLLENQMAQLRSALQAQGLNIDKLEVAQSQSTSMMFSQMGQEQENGRAFRNNSEQQDNEHVTDPAFEAEMAEQAAIQDLGYGRSINETA